MPRPFRTAGFGDEDAALKMAINAELDVFQVHEIVDRALKEDIGRGDLTCRALFGADEQTSQAATGPNITARIFAKADGVLCGAAMLSMTVKLASDALPVTHHKVDGDPLTRGVEIATIEGPAGPLLGLERTALNFMGKLSGIATHARRFVDAVKGTGVRIFDTRKTTPGWRLFEKYAVRTGGVSNHRLGLFQSPMLKENHLRASGLSLADAVRKLRAAYPNTPGGNHGPSLITVEVESLVELEAVLDAGADIVMLDDFDLEGVRKAVAVRDRFREQNASRHPSELEVSGGVTLDNVRKIAEIGPDRISVGAITHSAPALDLTLLVDEKAS